jgi:hypothetical protein
MTSVTIEKRQMMEEPAMAEKAYTLASAKMKFVVITTSKKSGTRAREVNKNVRRSAQLVT